VKKVLKLAGIFFVAALLAFVAIKSFVGYQSSMYKETAIPFIKVAVPEISKWDVDIIKSLMSRNELEKTPDEAIVEIVNHLGRMGRLKEMGEPVYESLDSFRTRSGNEVTIVTYSVDTKYENGDGIFTISLLVNDGSFKVYSFKINSQTLAENK